MTFGRLVLAVIVGIVALAVVLGLVKVAIITTTNATEGPQGPAVTTQTVPVTVPRP